MTAPTQNDGFQPPIDIPWRLAATTRPLAEEGSTDLHMPTVSIFMYQPDLPNLETNYPGEKLVYFKITVSTQPATSIQGEDQLRNDFVNSLLVFPVKRLRLDLRIQKGSGKAKTGDIKPYFISAAPMRREMLETGTIGIEAFSGASNGLTVGKSVSALHETTSNETNSSSFGWSAGIPLIGGVGGTSTSVSNSGTRDVTQSVDVTNRQASEERRELISHTTNINNIFTLLTVHHIGSPYLRFSLWPRPIQSNALDEQDENVWYAKILEHRSSGIEGTQDFFAVAVVPDSDDGWCINAELTEMTVPSPTPVGEFVFDQTSANDLAGMHDYLYQKYPPSHSTGHKSAIAVQHAT